jgi:heterodisulfide reductase subunit B2
MNVYYYPGCSLEGTAKEYRESLLAAAGTLGVNLKELPEWTCCGSSSAHVTDDDLAVSLAARNLAVAEKLTTQLVVPCSACFQRLKSADKKIKSGHRTDAAPDYQGKVDIKHTADYFAESFDKKSLQRKVKKPLSGLKAVCYYGCLTARPPKVTDAKGWEDPQAMDEIMSNLGADVKQWSFKTDCCGGSLMLTHPDLARKLVKKLYDMTVEAGADCIIVGCPMCQSNLDMYQKEIKDDAGNPYQIPVYYFTEMMGLAFGDPGAEKWLGKHITESRQLLKQKGLL